jgi:hypothetical protein
VPTVAEVQIGLTTAVCRGLQLDILRTRQQKPVCKGELHPRSTELLWHAEDLEKVGKPGKAGTRTEVDSQLDELQCGPFVRSCDPLGHGMSPRISGDWCPRRLGRFGPQPIGTERFFEGSYNAIDPIDGPVNGRCMGTGFPRPIRDVVGPPERIGLLRHG